MSPLHPQYDNHHGRGKRPSKQQRVNPRQDLNQRKSLLQAAFVGSSACVRWGISCISKRARNCADLNNYPVGRAGGEIHTKTLLLKHLLGAADPVRNRADVQNQTRRERGPSDRMLQRPRNFSKAVASVSAKSKYFLACSASWAFKADSARERNLCMRSSDDTMSPRKPKPCAPCASPRVFRLWAMLSARLDKRSRSWLNCASLAASIVTGFSSCAGFAREEAGVAACST